ncbi:N-acetyltransferase, GNAT family, putative [Trichophyton verrucosum HKI 0517]|uniref:N-acetyltransferase, GNAT family, putative n=1 Tax=Trichophyton verrucosum (strain HKI 0517) TaxID=663202 RepID=D4DIC7_TRIVH|nr:N-acetyltransferase, GNAT family, putative [Trichophyton verrucosum HKI 0517]EFE38389.1 N-acetyltransferase, GNAT family, putative [Trichophyton verrucosum HKI 0517]
MASVQPQRATEEEEKVKYPSAGAPPQPCRLILPYEAKEIVTPRMVLVPMTYDHAAPLVAMNAKLLDAWKNIPALHPMLKYLVHGIPDVSAQKGWMDSKRLQIPDSGELFFYFAVTLREETEEGAVKPGRIIGGIGMNQVLPIPNLGYSIDADLWGKGYGTEALKAFLEVWWAIPRRPAGEGEEEKPEKVYANVNKANIPSIRLLEKCGFNIYSERLMADDSVICFLEKARS